MIISHPCWQCELPGCGHIWVKTSDTPPDQCSKCRKRGWNRKGAEQGGGLDQVSAAESSPPPQPALRPAVQVLTDAVATSGCKVTIGREVVTRLPMPSRPAHAVNCTCTVCVSKKGKR
jgi:hypothetical protein